MDIFAGLPILVTSLVALLLLNWLRNERQYFEQDNPANQASGEPPVTAQLSRTMRWLQRIITGALIVAPLIMIFSGQLDAYGIADEFDGSLQFIAPFTSAVFSAAVFRLMILALVVVYVAHTRLLGRFRPTRDRKELW